MRRRLFARPGAGKRLLCNKAPLAGTGMNDESGRPPRGGWATMVAELHVSDLEVSLAFWRDLLGFAIAYRWTAEGFVYLERAEGQQLMLCRRSGRFETGAMRRPFGRGVMLQICLTGLDGVLAALAARGWPLYAPAHET